MRKYWAKRDHPAIAIALFLLTAFVIHAVLSLPAVQTAFLDPYTVGVAVAARETLQVFLPDVTGWGNILGDDQFRIQVLNVCNGTDLWVLFAAAVLAFPAPWRAKVVGLGVGLPLLSLVNLVRVIGLYLTGRYVPKLFDTSHLFLWQAALVLMTAGLFAVYLKWAYGRDVD